MIREICIVKEMLERGIRGVSRYLFSGPEVIKLFSCSTQLSMKFSLLINMKMPTKVGIFIFISREIFMLKLAFSYLLAEKISCSAMFSNKEFAIVSYLRFISMTNFMLS